MKKELKYISNGSVSGDSTTTTIPEDVKDVLDNSEGSKDISVDTSNGSSVDPQQKRGRGRPRLEKGDGRSCLEKGDEKKTEDQQRRGRGRPRKENENEKDDQLQKRGRGRPRKDRVVDEQAIDDLPTKRGRGRPRKNDDDDVQSQKRGRPRKVVVDNQSQNDTREIVDQPTKRGRGRPRKVVVDNPSRNDTRDDSNAPSLTISSPTTDLIKVPTMAVIVAPTMAVIVAPTRADVKEPVMTTAITTNEFNPSTSSLLEEVRNLSVIIDELEVRMNELSVEDFDKEMLMMSDEISMISDRISSILKVGFVTSTDIFDKKAFPHIAEFVPRFLLDQSNKNENENGKRACSNNDLSHDNRSDLYKWIFNTHMLDMYILLSRMMRLATRIDKDLSSLKKGDGYNSLKVLSAVLFNKMDPSLRDKLMKRGVSMSLNTNVGFDTEYVQEGSITNTLVSAQLAVNSRVLLKIPFNKPYEFASVDSLRGGRHDFSKTSKKIDYESILTNLRLRMDFLRMLKYGVSDYSLGLIINTLKERGYPYSVSLERDLITFAFPRTAVRTWFCDVRDLQHAKSIPFDKWLKDEYDRLMNEKIYLYRKEQNQKREQEVIDVKEQNQKREQEVIDDKERLNTMSDLSKYNNNQTDILIDSSIDSSPEPLDSSTDSPTDSMDDTIIDPSVLARIKEEVSNELNTYQAPSGLSLEDVVDRVMNMSESDISNSEQKVIDELISIFEVIIKPKLDSRFSAADLYKTEFLNTGFSTSGNLIKPDNFDVISDDNDEPNWLEEGSSLVNKKARGYYRSNMNSFSGDYISLSKMRNVYLAAHLTNADLSLLSDFKKYVKFMSIVQKSFVTLEKPIKFKRCNLHVRDTMLLAPSGNKSLSSIGKLYGDDFGKVKISNYEISHMDEFLRKDPVRFKEYAMMDVMIVLKHICKMEDYYFGLNRIGVPITSSSISKALISKKWSDMGYDGYQISPLIQLWDFQRSMTPKGMIDTGDLTLMIGEFVSNYKGGRNESFMYGIDRLSRWYDYDLTSAYTTVMFALGHPDYDGRRHLSSEVLEMRYDKNPISLIYSYMIIKGTFSFPTTIEKTVKYPSIPIYLDETTTVYPTSGECVLTGAEYVLARNQGCEIEVSSCVEIPFLDREWSGVVKEMKSNEMDSETPSVFDPSTDLLYRKIILKDRSGKPLVFDPSIDLIHKKFVLKSGKGGKGEWLLEDYVIYNRPFASVIKDIQEVRRESPKGSFQNTMAKLLGNSMYGLVVQGMSHKTHFDIPTDSMKRSEGSKFTNPLIASWITAVVRSIVGEMLHITNALGGRVVSVTTDGFITDIPDLEVKILEYIKKAKVVNPNRVFLIELVRIWRGKLSSDPRAIELKKEGMGIFSWSTRGQFSKDSGIAATTGFQRRNMSVDFLESLLIEAFNKGKEIEYINTSLRSGLDIYKHGGHVTRVYRDQRFRLFNDGRRCIIIPNHLLDAVYDRTLDWNADNVLLDSLPVEDISHSKMYRTVASLNKTVLYSRRCTMQTGVTKYRDYKELAYRNFVKAYYGGLCGLSNNHFDSIKQLIAFIRTHDETYNPSVNSIIKMKGRKITLGVVPAITEVLNFVEYIKKEFPDFREGEFMGRSSE